jgi:putative ABC transport system substrate-binding protein
MNRREFITLVGGAAVLWPLVALGQQPERMRRIGVLMVRTENDREGQSYAAAFRGGLAALGWVPGQNVEIEYRWQAGDTSQAQAFAKELVRFRPDILVANATPSLAAMQKATRCVYRELHPC